MIVCAARGTCSAGCAMSYARRTSKREKTKIESDLSSRDGKRWPWPLLSQLAVRGTFNRNLLNVHILVGFTFLNCFTLLVFAWIAVVASRWETPWETWKSHAIHHRPQIAPTRKQSANDEHQQPHYHRLWWEDESQCGPNRFSWRSWVCEWSSTMNHELAARVQNKQLKIRYTDNANKSVVRLMWWDE